MQTNLIEDILRSAVCMTHWGPEKIFKILILQSTQESHWVFVKLCLNSRDSNSKGL